MISSNCVLVIYDDFISESPYGDPVTAGQRGRTVRALVTEKSIATADPTNEHPVIRHYYHIVLPADSDARKGYRLVDESNGGRTYVIDYVKSGYAFMGWADIEVECHLI